MSLGLNRHTSETNYHFKDEESTILPEVVGLGIKRGIHLIKGWRIQSGLTQKEVAKRVVITQAALSQMKKGNILEDVVSELTC
jgi:predicted XRE-type DNA-binding protein